MKKLYPIQEKFVNNIRTSLAKHKRIIAAMATGGGKTVVFISIAKAAIAKGKTVLILTESTKIYKQIHEEIGSSVNIGDGVKEKDIELGAKAYVAMAQTLVRRKKIVEWFNSLGENLLIINDEAHINTASTVIKMLNPEKSLLLGFTATPDGRSAKHLKVLYKDIVVGPMPIELVDLGLLSPYYHFERKTTDLTTLEKGANGEFTEKSQEDMFKKNEVYEGVFEDIKKFPYKKCMVFCSSISHAEDIAHQFRSHGYKVACVHSQNPESNYELFQFENLLSGVDICISVASLTKGYNLVSVDLIILLIATVSLSKYLQVVGRGSRISPFTNKKSFTVIDLGGNGTRHLPWNYEHNWEELFLGKKIKKVDGVAPVRECKSCGALLHASVMVCPYCNFVFPKPTLTPKETELVEINTRYNALRGRKISTLTPSELVDYAKSTNKKKYAERIAKSKGMDFLREYGFLSGYKETWVYATHTDEPVEFYDIEIK